MAVRDACDSFGRLRRSRQTSGLRTPSKGTSANASLRAYVWLQGTPMASQAGANSVPCGHFDDTALVENEVLGVEV
jgi:hypothetical protein